MDKPAAARTAEVSRADRWEALAASILRLLDQVA
jgi:hypothetical protein